MACGIQLQVGNKMGAKAETNIVDQMNFKFDIS